MASFIHTYIYGTHFLMLLPQKNVLLSCCIYCWPSDIIFWSELQTLTFTISCYCSCWTRKHKLAQMAHTLWFVWNAFKQNLFHPHQNKKKVRDQNSFSAPEFQGVLECILLWLDLAFTELPLKKFRAMVFLKSLRWHLIRPQENVSSA